MMKRLGAWERRGDFKVNLRGKAARIGRRVESCSGL